MKREKAKQVVQNALIGYIEDSAGADTPEANEIQEAWNTILEPEVTSEEAKNMRTILDHLDIYSELYDTQMKVMRGLGIKI